MAAAGNIAEIKTTEFKVNNFFKHEVNIRKLSFHAYFTSSTMKSHKFAVNMSDRFRLTSVTFQEKRPAYTVL